MRSRKSLHKSRARRASKAVTEELSRIWFCMSDKEKKKWLNKWRKSSSKSPLYTYWASNSGSGLRSKLSREYNKASSKSLNKKLKKSRKRRSK